MKRPKTGLFVSGTLLFLYSAILILICLFAYKRPAYNWDMLSYMAIVLKIDLHDPTRNIHNLTYETAGKYIPAAEYRLLTLGPYREKMQMDSSAFYAQLPIYTVKPLYTGLAYLFYKAGFTLTKATVLPSILAYFLTGLLLFQWLGKYYVKWSALITGILILFSGFMVATARLSSPDGISSFLLLTAFYFIIEKPSVGGMFIFFVLSIFARLDNIIACIIVISFLYFTGQWEKSISLKQYVFMLLFFLASYVIVSIKAVYPSGWNILYLPSFLRYLNPTGAFQGIFSINKYLSYVYSHAITTVVYHQFTLFIFLGIITASPFKAQFSKVSFDQWFSLLMIFILFARFIIFPNIEDRFNTAYYLCILVLLVRKYTNPGFLPGFGIGLSQPAVY